MFKVVFWASSWSCTVVDVSVAFAGALQLLLLLLSLAAVRCPLSLSCCCCWCSLLLGGYGTGKAPFLFEVRHKSLRVWGVQAFRPCSCGISTSGAFIRSGHQPSLCCFTKQLATAAMPAVAKMIDCCVGTERPQWNSFASLSSLGCNDRAAAS